MWLIADWHIKRRRGRWRRYYSQQGCQTADSSSGHISGYLLGHLERNLSRLRGVKTSVLQHFLNETIFVVLKNCNFSDSVPQPKQSICTILRPSLKQT